MTRKGGLKGRYNKDYEGKSHLLGLKEDSKIQDSQFTFIIYSISFQCSAETSVFRCFCSENFNLKNVKTEEQNVNADG